MADILIDNKALAKKAQKKKEEMLEKQVKILENKLERVSNSSLSDLESNENSLELENEAAIEIDSNNIDLEENTNENYDIVLKVKPEKVPQIKSQIIDGKKYLVIPVDENEQANVNGIDNIV